MVQQEGQQQTTESAALTPLKVYVRHSYERTSSADNGHCIPYSCPQNWLSLSILPLHVIFHQLSVLRHRGLTLNVYKGAFD